MTLLVVSGPPGAGKSTVAALIAERSPGSVVVEGDRFFTFFVDPIDPWLKEANEQNGVSLEAAALATARYVRHGYPTVYEGVLGPWFLPLFLETAELASVHYVVLLPDVERCVERVTGRSGHHFGDGPATRTMHRQFARAAIGHRHVIELDAPPAAIADEVLRRRDDEQLLYSAS